MNEGSNNPRAACLIGWPAGHSRSPVIHRYWLKELGIAGDYRIEPVQPDGFGSFIRHLSAQGYVGANITIPHKEQALDLAEGDALTRAIGAANTLWLDGEVLRATNTDVEGFINNLDADAPGWDRAGGDALVFGAGGASRAVLFGLLDRGIETIHLANRTRERSDALVAQFGERVRSVEWNDAARLLPRVRLLVNTTSLGMKGQPPLELDLRRMPDDAVVADLVYVPLQTDLLRAAEKRGLRTADGLGMLLHQAVGGFALWFGQRPQVTSELRAFVKADLVGC